MNSKKKILIICKETYSIPNFFLAEKLLENYEIAFFFAHTEESYYKECIYNSKTYYRFKKRFKNLKIYDLRDVVEKFHSNNFEINSSYIDYIEKNYTYYKNLNLQLISSQLTSRHHHDRFYFNKTNYLDNKNILGLFYQKVEKVFNDFEPDYIFDNDDSELIRTIINEVSYAKKIPYLSMDYSRYEAYKIPTYTLGNRPNELLNSLYKKFNTSNSLNLDAEYSYITDFRNKSKIMALFWMGTPTSRYQPDKFSKMMKVIYGKIKYFIQVYLFTSNIFIYKKNSQFLANPVKYLYFLILIEIKKQYLLRGNKYFQKPSDIDTYVYMPLHYMPESTTFTRAPFYIDELFLITQLSKSLPINWYLYVKEHQSMVGERPLNFYKKVNELPNVKLININHYDDPKELLERSRGVVTVTGTSGYEALMLGKKVLLFGNPSYSLISGATKIASFEDLPRLLKQLEEPLDNLKSCASYIRAVKELGIDIDLDYLTNEGENILRNNLVLPEKYTVEIDKFIRFYENFLKIYNKNRIFNEQ